MLVNTTLDFEEYELNMMVLTSSYAIILVIM